MGLDSIDHLELSDSFVNSTTLIKSLLKEKQNDSIRYCLSRR